MRMSIVLPVVVCVSLLIGCGGTEDVGEAKNIKGKHVLMIIAGEDFRDEELFDTRKVIEENEGKVTVASTILQPITGTQGKEAKADVLIDDVDVSEYDAVVFVGGPGAQQYYEDETAHDIAKRAVEEGKVLGAICIAPAILAKAGVLEGKSATVFKSEKDILTGAGAKYIGKGVVTDGDIITADGPKASKAFGRAITNRLAEK